MIDQYQSHLGYNYVCRYWKRDKKLSDINLDKYIISEDPEGMFYARPITPNSYEKQTFAGSFMFDSSTVTIETPDIVKITSGDVVEYKGKLWRVSDVQEYEDDDTSEFGIPSKNTYIHLKK